MDARITVIEDDESFAEFLKILLEEEGYLVEVYTDPLIALKKLPFFKPHLVITDLKMPKIDGISLIEKTKKFLPDTEFVIITAYGSIPSAVEAIKKGATDYITKPLPSPEEFLRLVKRLLKNQAEKTSEISEEIPPFEVLFAGMENTYEKILKVAPTDTTVLLYGETGTGKSLIAKTIHFLSKRKGNFVEINCASLPENLFEAELFGYEKGAFTGATKTKPGKIELATDGTLFLDEISEMSLGMQAKFLKVLQERTFERLGGLKTIKTNARFITATNKDLKKLVKEGLFREDLYFRISVFPVYILPLRERGEAILKIAEFLIQKICKRLNKNVPELSKKAKKLILDYSWPGNIRELENVLERSLILCQEEKLEVELYSEETNKDFSDVNLKSLEKQAIISALKKTKGDKKKASKILGISLRTLYNKIKEYDLKDFFP